ncbi:conserved hypothetical protein [Beggiatoa sp. PS]|nr:conserved hypothetical protein [Beggiatoa sp. PS]
MRIHSIILYNEKGEHRKLSFKEGVNIIAGTQNTGKSAIITIIEYCLGNSELNIKDSTVSENVVFYAVIYQLSDRQVIVAKPKPPENRTTEPRAFYKEEQNIVIPTLTELRNNIDTNDTVVKKKLSQLLDITYPFSIQDTLFLLFQDKQTIARNNIIFYKQDRENIRNISNRLSYFLGIVQSEDIKLNKEIDILTKQKNGKNAEFKRIKERNRDKLEEGQRLLNKTKGLNLIAQDVVVQELNEFQQLFQIALQKIGSSIQSQPKTLLKGIDEISIKKLDQEMIDLKQKMESLKDDINELESYFSEANKYDNNAREQINRLNSARLFSNNTNLFLETDKCPLCFSSLEKEIVPKIQAIQTEIERLNSHIQYVEIEQKETSDINKRLSELKIQSKQLKQEIQNRNKEKKRIEDNSQAPSFYQRALSANQPLLETKGAIESFLESLSNYRSDAFLQEEVKNINEEIGKLKQQQAAEREAKETYENGCLKYINEEKMKSFAQQLSLEDEPFGFKVKELKIYMYRNGKAKPLINVTGKSEIVGCHLSLCLALHSFFSKKLRPVPRFLVLDQPTQGYTETTDKEKISAMFNMFFEFCKSMNIQIIITEHVNLQDHKKFKGALVEDYWTGEQDRALIPSQWITNT